MDLKVDFTQQVRAASGDVGVTAPSFFDEELHDRPHQIRYASFSARTKKEAKRLRKQFIEENGISNVWGKWVEEGPAYDEDDPWSVCLLYVPPFEVSYTHPPGRYAALRGMLEAAREFQHARPGEAQRKFMEGTRVLAHLDEFWDAFDMANGQHD